MAAQRDPLICKLIQRLHDPDVITRRNAAGALRLHGERAACALPDLVQLLADEDVSVRNEARRAVDQLARAVA